MAIDDDIDRHLRDWIKFDEMLADVAAANNVEVPRLQYWLHLKRFCDLRPFRFWHPHIEYQQFYPKVRDKIFVEGAVLVEFLLGSDCFPDRTTLWALQNGGVAFWQKSVVSAWLRDQDANVPDHWNPASPLQSSSRPAQSAEQGEHWVTKAEILEHKWPLPTGEKVPQLEKVLDDLPLWVSEACKKVGRPGYGARYSHQWNPAMLAVCLATRTSHKRWSSSKAALDRVIRNHYPKSIAEWERHCESL